MDEDVQSLLGQRRYRPAFERLLDLYQQKVFRMAIMFMKDHARAEEVTQDIFLKLWQVLPAYDGRAAPGTWLYAIARNTCLSALRSAALRQTRSLDSAPEPATPAPTAASDAVNQMQLKRCLERLPEAQHQVITMFYLQEKNIDEVSRMLDLPEGTVKSHLHRARRALTAMMKE